MTLTPGELYCLQAAEGWLELGNYVEAIGELEEIEPFAPPDFETLLRRSRTHPAYYEPIEARELRLMLPEFKRGLPDTWFHLAYAWAKRGDVLAAEVALKRCFSASVKTQEDTKWPMRANLTKELDGLWHFHQLLI